MEEESVNVEACRGGRYGGDRYPNCRMWRRFWKLADQGYSRGVEDIADIKADLEGLRGQLEDLAQQTAALERALEAPPDTGDDWRLVRDAASPQLRHAVKVYADCRAGEWSHPGGDPVVQDSVLDAAGLAIAAGLEEAVWRDMATLREGRPVQ